MTVKISTTPPESITFCAGMGDYIVRFRADGAIDVGEGYTPTEAGEVVIEHMKHRWRMAVDAQSEIERLQAECERLRNQLSVATAYARGSMNI